MSEAYIGEIRLFPYNYVPQGWLPCQGQQLPAQQYQALYALIGNVYGSAPSMMFYLPDLRGRSAISAGAGSALGQATGNSGVTLSTSQLPAHNHPVVANPYVGTSNSPAGNMRFGTDSAASFMTYKISPSTQPTQMAANVLSPSATAAAQPHENRQPFLALQFCICWDGIWPDKPD